MYKKMYFLYTSRSGVINVYDATSTKDQIRDNFKFYSQDLINNLFFHPYTKIELVERDLKVSRLTATKYLDTLAVAGFLKKEKVGRSNYYVNTALFGILTKEEE